MISHGHVCICASYLIVSLNLAITVRFDNNNSDNNEHNDTFMWQLSSPFDSSITKKKEIEGFIKCLVKLYVLGETINIFDTFSNQLMVFVVNIF